MSRPKNKDEKITCCVRLKKTTVKEILEHKGDSKVSRSDIIDDAVIAYLAWIGEQDEKN